MAFKLSRASSFIGALVVTSAVALGAMSCGEDSKKEEAAAPITTTTTIKYADVSTFVNANCANSGCHNATTKAGSYDMSTIVGIAAKASKSVTRIEEKTMPQVGSAQKTAFDADKTNSAKVLEWLKAGAPE